MILLYLALSYMIGIALGSWLWQQGVIDCDLPSWLWILPLLPLLPLLWWDRQRAPAVPLRWPLSAGFESPRPQMTPLLLFAIGLVLMAGLLRYGSRPSLPCWTHTDLAYYNALPDDPQARQVSVVGTVSSYPLLKDGRQRLHLNVESIVIDGESRAVSGQLRLTASQRPRYRYGDRLQATGILVTPPKFDSFDYRAYLSRWGVHSLLQRPRLGLLPGEGGDRLMHGIYALRHRGEVLINRMLPEPYAALLNGMLLGIESGIPNDLYDQFNLTGTSHVIVISGSNVAIVSAVLVALLARVVGRRRALWPTLTGIALYALLVGGDAAVVRAALMGSLVVIATSISRQSTALVSLAVACWVMTLLNPLSLWDVGFQLSAAATAGLILFSPKMSEAFDRIWPGFGKSGHLTGNGGALEAGSSLLRGLLQDGLLMTLSANLTTLPLVVYYFERLSIISPLTNLLIAPVQPFIMLWGGAGVIAGWLGVTPLAQVLLWIPYLSLLWTVTMVQWTAALPGASMVIADYGGRALAITYLLLAIFRWRSWLRERLHQVWSMLSAPPAPAAQTATGDVTDVQPTPSRMGFLLGNTALAGLAIACFLVWRIVLTQPDGYLHVHFLDVGQGDGIFIQTPSGRQVLIDGGIESGRLFNQLSAVMPFWDRSIDLVVLSHPDADHMAAQLALSERYQIDQTVVSGVTMEHADGRPWLAAMAGTPVDVQWQGGWLDLGDGVALWTLWPWDAEQMRRTAVPDDDKNEQSLVMKLVYGDFSVLLTGDAGVSVETLLVRQNAPIAAQLLKAGHHGSRSSTSPAFVEAVNPLVSVIQVGENRYGHPHPDVLEALAGRLILRNDEHGRIHVWSDGRQMWIDADDHFSLNAFE